MTGSIAAVVFLTLIACLVLTVPIGFSLGIASLGYILYTKQLTFGFIAQTPSLPWRFPSSSSQVN